MIVFWASAGQSCGRGGDRVRWWRRGEGVRWRKRIRGSEMMDEVVKEWDEGRGDEGVRSRKRMRGSEMMDEGVSEWDEGWGRTCWSTTIPSRKMAVHEGSFMLLFREFYQAKTVKTHSNNLVVLAHIQLKPFYHLSTHDVTHVRKCARPSPVSMYCKRWEAGWEPGNKATMGTGCNTAATWAMAVVSLPQAE